MLTRINCPIVYVDDVDVAVSFYTGTIGFTVVERSGDFVELTLGDTRLALNKADGLTKVAGRQTLILESDGIAADFARLQSELEILEPLCDHGYGPTFIFSDPFGNKLEVI